MARGPLAGAAGPGKFSKRTDMEMGSLAYGEGKETKEIKGGAKLAKTPDAARVSTARPQGKSVRLFDDSERPNEPITSGIGIGDGPGEEALGINRPQMQPQEEDDVRFRAAIRDYMPVLAYIASKPDTSPETRKVIRQLRDSL
jgi:hypothetical protein